MFISFLVLLPKLLEYKEKYGGIVKLHIGQIPNFLVVNDYKRVEFFMNSSKTLDKAEEYRFVREWLGKGLLLSDAGKLSLYLTSKHICI